MTLLEVEGLTVRFAAGTRELRAVDDLSLSLAQGEALALVGESGSGKSTALLALAGLAPRGARVSARAWRFGGREIAAAPERALRGLRGREIGFVFQDPLAALDPLMTIGDQLAEVLAHHEGLRGRPARARAAAALGEVGIASPEERLDAFPHQLSGGMRQRALIALALLLRPRLVLADEPTTALDATVQAQVLELLGLLRAKHGTAVLLVTHSLGVVAGFADRVAVMYAGRVVEEAATDEIFARPRHPYTRALLASVPRLDAPLGARLAAIPGSPPDLARLPAGCAFAPRCALAIPSCAGARPPLARDARGAVACPVAEREAAASAAGGAA